MLRLEQHIKLTKEVWTSPNITGMFSSVDLTRIGGEVLRGYREDKRSRQVWEERSAAGMDLAMQVVREKSFPWPNASNVAFPLVTIAAMQFHSRAYPAIVSGSDVVKCRVPFEVDGDEQAQADLIGRYMSHQLLEQSSTWEEGQDRLLLNYAIVGCAFKKSYFDSQVARVTSDVVLAKDLVLDYYAKSVENARRKTHVYPLTKNEIYSGAVSDTPKFRDVTGDAWFQGGGLVADDKPNRDGTSVPSRDSDTPFTALEQHCWLDLDGDGYEEPWIVTVEEGSQTVLRIVARWDREQDVVRNARGQVVSITPVEYFTKYGFIPAPDNSIYDIGFGVLLGPLNESVSSLVNMLIDAGVMATTAGGFLGRGAKIRGGDYTFAPLEWKRVDSTGDDLRKSIVPLDVREPSAVLFNLLGLLIEYTNRIAGTMETMVGENPGQNTPASNMASMVEQGMKIYAAIFKRTWRAMKEEFKKIFILNGLHAPSRYRQLFLGDPELICPAADPNISSDSERFSRALAIVQRSDAKPGYDPNVVEENYLRALRVDNWKKFYRGFDPSQVPKDPRIQIEEMRGQREMALHQSKQETEMQKFLAQLLEDQRMNQAEQIKMQAETVKLLAEADDAADNRQIVAMQTAISAVKQRDESLRGRIDQLIKIMELESDPNRQVRKADEIRGLASSSGDGSLVPIFDTATGRSQGSVVKR